MISSDPTEDARLSMELYRKHATDPIKLQKAKEKLSTLSQLRRFPNFSVKTKYQRCPGMYAPKKCWCGQPSMINVREADDITKLMKNVQIVDTAKLMRKAWKPHVRNGLNGVCHQWQQQKKCSYIHCRYLHICIGCGGGHPQSSCNRLSN